MDAKNELEACKFLLEDLSMENITDKVINMCLDVGITAEYGDPIHKTRRTVSDYYRVQPI